MNLYLTTMHIASPDRSVPKIVLDSCIESLFKHFGDATLHLKGIIVPSWTNPENISNYRGVPVQSVVTRKNNPNLSLKPRDEELLSYETTNVNKRTHEKKHWSNNTTQGENDSDNEHQAMFEHMECNYPCLVADGDIIFDNRDFSALKIQLRKHGKSEIILPRSHLVYLHNAEDKKTILLSANSKWGGVYYKTMHCRKGLVNIVVNKVRASLKPKAKNG